MKPNASRPRSKNIIITACVFLVGLMCWGVMMQDLYDKRMTSLRDHCRLDAVVFADELQQDFSEGESIVNGLAMSIANSKEHMMEDFDSITDYVVRRSEIPIDSVQLLPGGVVSAVYPSSKWSALGYDAFAAPQRKLALQYAEQNHELIILGPTDPQSDGMALAMMMPVFLDVGASRPQELWGFTAVYIKVPDVFSRTVTNMDKSDLAYRLEKTGFSYNDYATILESDVAPVDPVSYTFSYGGCQWRIQLAPRNGWNVMSSFGAAAALGLVALLMLTALTYILLFMHDRQKSLRQMAMTDQLTGMLNRHGLEA
ncbi:CHASE domain-containing protein, partial [Mitsuokella multacida]